jgi:hypothetical protein
MHTVIQNLHLLGSVLQWLRCRWMSLDSRTRMLREHEIELEIEAQGMLALKLVSLRGRS